ncbi:MAG: hypothetical protein GQ565_07035 [Candidatus Aegiribacteria sp.]|nr:hypothetical protein [Candidatus Aegiribacteria sp.]
MVIRCRIVCATAALLILIGCTDLTEFDHTLQAGITIMSAADLSVVNTIENIFGARSLCIIPDCFIVATTEGTVLRFDLATHQRTGVFTIGSPSPSGYSEIEYSSTESSVYIIGALGQIVEMHVPDMEVMDTFSICETPVDIEIVVGKPCFYVAGGTSHKIFEVRKENNRISRTCALPISPICMAIDQDLDSMLVGTLGGTELVSIGETVMRRRAMHHLPAIQAIETIPNDTTFCAVISKSTDKIVTILRYFPGTMPPLPLYTGSVPIEGDIHYMCVKPDGSRVYVLSYLGDNTSRLVSYNCGNYFIENQIDLQGYPLDLAISPGGTLLALTAE